MDGREIILDNAESLLKDIGSGKINGSKFKREYSNIIDDMDATLQKPMLTRYQEKMVEILSLLKEIPKFKDKKLDKEPDTTYILELESKDYAEQRGQGLKILTLSQMFSRSPISIKMEHQKI